MFVKKESILVVDSFDEVQHKCLSEVAQIQKSLKHLLIRKHSEVVCFIEIKLMYNCWCVSILPKARLCSIFSLLF